MAVISGNAKKHDGSQIDYVSIFNWSDGKCIAQVVPDAQGDWSYSYSGAPEIGITYVADGCKPITHGAYNLITSWTPVALQPKLYLDTESATWSGSNVTAWQDMSGEQSNFLTFGTITKTADGALSIPSGDIYLYNDSVKAKSILSGIGKAWVFMVVKPKANDATLFMVTDTSGATYNPRLAILYERGLFTMFSSRNSFTTNNFFDSTAKPVNDYHMVLLEHDWQTGRVAWYINGALDTFDDNHITDKGLTNAAQADNKVYIGQYATSDNSAPHEQKSLAIYTDKILTQAEIDKLFGYAAHKHGLTNKLPSGHPYKLAAP